MTNMWLGIDVEKLCDQHLLGLHKEIHQEAGTIQNHPHGDAIVEGHFRLGQVDSTVLNRRHEEVVGEMLSRGMNHRSPLDYDDVKGLMESSGVAELINKISLAHRCSDCF